MRFPDGWVLLTRISGPEVKDGKAFAEISVDKRELVMCKNCKHLDKEDYCCTRIGVFVEPDWFCADGERKEAGDGEV